MNYEIHHRGHLHADEPSSGPGGRSAFQGTERRVRMNGGCLGWIKADLSACHNVRLLWRGTCLVRVAWSHSVAELGATHTYPYGGSGRNCCHANVFVLNCAPLRDFEMYTCTCSLFGENSLPLVLPLLRVRPGLHRYYTHIFAPAGAECALNHRTFNANFF